ncbi:MAG: anthranilate synthase component I [Candidatus Omnitrophica bacterium]|nr:anthranilate synthase component I [Candidatus Omnitrophota bacterium]
MNELSQQEFLKLSKRGNLIPVFKEIMGDLDTPVSAYYKIAANDEYAFLLESVEGEEKVARFSFLARSPELVLCSKGDRYSVTECRSGKVTEGQLSTQETPLAVIRKIMRRYRFVQVPGLPRFCGGMVGYLSYDLVRHFERLPAKTTDDLRLPETYLMLAKDLIIFDHVRHRIKIISCVEVAPKATEASKIRQFKRARKVIEGLINDLRQPLQSPKNKIGRTGKKNVELQVQSNMDEPTFQDMVRKAKKQIRSGEIIQVVLSQRFQVNLKTDPFNIYRALRALNPSPYMYCLKFGGIKVIGSSPELLVRCEDGIVETRPIAGTRPRGKDEAEDARLAADLLQDDKEKAEHIMLVDLGRNDLGRVCQKGTVHLSEFMSVEKYSHVMHIVSNVRGKLQKGMDDFDVLKAAFPAGTVSGAPKIRAMEIIEDLERIQRGPYAGCIGYFSFSGNLDTCITIRTIVTYKNKAYIQAGAGIVADSVPKKEYQETLNKARAQIMAIELAHQQLEGV